jgi:hypothetical protein
MAMWRWDSTDLHGFLCPLLLLLLVSSWLLLLLLLLLQPPPAARVQQPWPPAPAIAAANTSKVWWVSQQVWRVTQQAVLQDVA